MKISKIAVAWQIVKTVIQFGIGAFCTFIFGIYLLLYATNFDNTRADGASPFVLSLVLTLVGALLLWLACRTSVLLARLDRYRWVLKDAPEKTVDFLARALIEEPIRVQKNLRRMIRRGLVSSIAFEHVHAPAAEGTNAVKTEADFAVSPQPDATPSPVQKSSAEEPIEDGDWSDAYAPIEKITVTCPHCRGVNIVTKGGQVPCDYCKQIIQG